MAQPYWWFKNQDAKNSRCSRRIVLGFFFTFIYAGVSIKAGYGRSTSACRTSYHRLFGYKNDIRKKQIQHNNDH